MAGLNYLVVKGGPDESVVVVVSHHGVLAAALVGDGDRLQLVVPALVDLAVEVTSRATVVPKYGVNK